MYCICRGKINSYSYLDKNIVKIKNNIYNIYNIYFRVKMHLHIIFPTCVQIPSSKYTKKITYE
jgi:hypothetical protein